MVAALQEANARLRDRTRSCGENAELKAQLAEQAEKIARLERLISRNRGNSSMPPSTDDQPGKKPPERRPRQGGSRRPGKQPGAPGAFLAWNDHPDKTTLSRQGICPCGADLAGARDLGVRYSHQVTDLPEARAVTIQHDRHEVRCACGRIHVAERPAGGGGRTGHGDLRAELPGLVRVLDGDAPRPGGTLRGHHRVDVRHPPQRRVGARPAGPRRPGGRRGEQGDPGADHPGPRRLRRRDPAAGGAGPEVPQEVPAGRLHHPADLLLPRRPGPGLLPGFVYSDLHGTVVVHDRYLNYDSFDGISHQLCTQHLLRDLEDAAESYPEAIWPGQVARALRALIHAANLARGQGLAVVPDERSPGTCACSATASTPACPRSAASPAPKSKQPPARHLLECLRHREADVLRFLTDTAIPPTSNQAERDLRPAKTQQKISGRLRSEKTTRDRYAIRGYASTAAKHGHRLHRHPRRPRRKPLDTAHPGQRLNQPGRRYSAQARINAPPCLDEGSSCLLLAAQPPRALPRS